MINCHGSYPVPLPCSNCSKIGQFAQSYITSNTSVASSLFTVIAVAMKFHRQEELIMIYNQYKFHKKSSCSF